MIGKPLRIQGIPKNTKDKGIPKKTLGFQRILKALQNCTGSQETLELPYETQKVLESDTECPSET